MLSYTDPWAGRLSDSPLLDTVFYTTSVINTPSRPASDIDRAREKVTGIALRPIRREAAAVLEAIRLRDEAKRREILDTGRFHATDRPWIQRTSRRLSSMRNAKEPSRIRRRSLWSMRPTGSK